MEDLQLKALDMRPDLRAAKFGITAAQSQILLAKANAKVDVNGTFDYTHVSGENTASMFVNFALPIFNRNQGEIARTGYALTQAQELQQSASDAVLSDVANAYEAVRSNDEVVQLYSFRIPQAGAGFARHQRVCLQAGSRKSSGFSRCRAQLPVRSVGLSPGIGLLYDRVGTVEGSSGDEKSAMNMRKDLWQLTVAAAIMLVFVGCKGPGSNAVRLEWRNKLK